MIQQISLYVNKDILMEFFPDFMVLTRECYHVLISQTGEMKNDLRDYSRIKDISLYTHYYAYIAGNVSGIVNMFELDLEYKKPDVNTLFAELQVRHQEAEMETARIFNRT